MDKVYLFFLILMIVSMLICIKYARRIKSDVASSIVKCFVFAIITILCNGLFAFSKNETFSYLMEAGYLFSIDMVLIYILEYTQQYTGVFREISFIRNGCFIIAYLDGIALFLSAIFQNEYKLEKVYYMNFQMYHIVEKNLLYYLHYVFAYCMVVCIVASFILKIRKVPYFYRKKYSPILVVMCVIIAINFICDVSGFPIDLSLPFFFICSDTDLLSVTVSFSERTDR